MIQYLDPVPFTIENHSHLGLSETEGMISCDGRNIVIEYRIADTVLRVLKTATKSVMIPLDAVQSIRYQKKYFGFVNEILLRTRNQGVLDGMPEAKSGSLVMKLARKERGDGEAFCLAVHQQIVQLRNQLLTDEIDSMLGAGD